MKVLNLRCANAHAFEGWFAGEDAFTDQNDRGAIECPMCGDRAVTRLPSAPRLNLTQAGPRPPGAAAAAAAGVPDQAKPRAGQPPASLQAAWLQAVRQLMERTEDVGERFAEEARRIHYGETEHRGIRGQTTAVERDALLDEGIEIMSIPVPAALKGPVQ